MTPQNKNIKKIKDVASQQKKDEEFTCYFCKKSGHMKKKCSKYTAWHVKKGKYRPLVYSEVNLAFVPKDTWWVDSGATTHISVSIQGYLWSGLSNDDERFIVVSEDKRVVVEAIWTFRL